MRNDQQRLAQALNTLQSLPRVVFLLRRIDGLDYDDIGWRCGITTAEVTKYMAEALYAMDRALNPETIPVHRRRIHPLSHSMSVADTSMSDVA